ncbi:RNA polymerase sigma factor SigJ [Microbacterium aurugineum]|uniref:RNA polymerase sigma factor SigJ n=1 Tax=Microbacterium aurugineum TaxID=2851642 RepID=UPI0020C0D5B5|nr:RNA polymerase sigma factor SigJ [Microbacterium aurugineum]MCK8476465.1 RNA polymerase sigma factor SigJ [Microbacterium aurugineum]
MDDLEVIDAERRTLLALAYRLLGTVADAEDAVQETYVRWYRMSVEERAQIRNPAAWLTRVAGRICLDALGSARARRERYVGPWLPEPVPHDSLLATRPHPDPLERMTLDESVGMALLVVLESLTPAERVAFVLHDVFGVPFAEIAETVGRSPDAVRQLASQGRRRVRERRAVVASREQHDAVARAFLAAASTGELDGLIALLDPDVVLVSDGGGKKSAALRPVAGADRVARFLRGIAQRHPEAEVSLVAAPDGLVMLATIDGRADAVFSFVVRVDRITEVFAVRNPDKLSQWP